jgi:outer membrane murein-binding lipoprotein Lpp
MRAKQLGGRWGILAAVLGLLGASGCASQEQVDQVAVELQQMRAQARHREAELEALTQRLSAMQGQLDRANSAGERAEMVESMKRLAESNEALRATMAERSGGAPGAGSWRADGQHSVAQSGADEAELRQIVLQLRQIAHGHGPLTPYQQHLLLRALRPQRELDRENPWEPKIDRSNPWGPASNVEVSGSRLDKSNPWH